MIPDQLGYVPSAAEEQLPAELHKRVVLRREIEPLLLSPKLDDSNFVMSSCLLHLRNVSSDVRLSPRISAPHIEAVIVSLVVLSSGGNQINVVAADPNCHRDVLHFRRVSCPCTWLDSSTVPSTSSCA